MSVIINLPKPPSKDIICPICREDETEAQGRTWSVHTGENGGKHAIHSDCFSNSLLDQQRCPICKEDIDRSKTIKDPYVIQGYVYNARPTWINEHAQDIISLNAFYGLLLGALGVAVKPLLFSATTFGPQELALGSCIGTLAGVLLGIWKAKSNYLNYYCHNIIPSNNLATRKYITIPKAIYYTVFILDNNHVVASPSLRKARFKGLS